jgi:hypothetical protein
VNGASLKYDELEAALSAIVQPNSVFELRLISGRRKRIDAGYFDNVGAAATALSELDEPYKGVYLTPNPLNPDLLARAANRVKPWAEFTTSDKDVLRRLWLLIDIDPERPSDISSTNLEHRRAITKAREIAGMLEVQYGWCEPMLNSSGNGAHLLYPMNEPNDEATRDTIKLFLQCLNNRFKGYGCAIDTSVYNAARIWRLPGTLARKGDSTADRPHRKARIIQGPPEYDFISLEQIQEFIDENPIPSAAKPERPTTRPDGDGEAIYRRLNNAAMHRLEAWVLEYFPGAKKYQKGYRVSSHELMRDREEDISIQPYPVGILDFGEHDMGDAKGGKRTPVSLIAEYHTEGDLKEAAQRLADHLNLPINEFSKLSAEDEEKEDVKSYREVFGEGNFDLKDIKSFTQLQSKSFKALNWIIPQVLPAGAFILAARPKMRKTWLALQLSVAVATGGKFLDWTCSKGESLYLGLEDNERRLKSRIETLHTFDFEIPDLSGFHYFTEGTFPRGDDGCDVLRKWLDEHPACRLVVIDTFAHFRKLSNERDVYLKDYLAAMPLTRLASEREVCLIIVHHEKKGLASQPSGDFLEDVNGSSGLTGGVDGVISIKGRRGVQEENESRKLMITGRDVPHDYELDMAFDAERGGWLKAARQDASTAIRHLFTIHPFLTQSEIIALLPNIPPGRIKAALVDMKFARELEQGKHGYSRKG